MLTFRLLRLVRSRVISTTSILNSGTSKSISSSSSSYSSQPSSSGEGEGTKTHFGFKTVEEDEKQEKVNDVFHNVADKYDLMNDAMSFGIHRLWKDEFMWRLNPDPSTQLLDVAGGTGDIAFRFLRNVHTKMHMNNFTEQSTAHVSVADINSDMLRVGQNRAVESGFSDDEMTWVEANAENLPFDDDKFDAYTIAFGIRNCTHLDKVLSEAYRVLKPGGRFMCLEFSEVQNSILAELYDQYSFKMIPVLGQLLAGDWNSYQYLVESIRKFPNQHNFASMIEDANFECVTHSNMNNGIVAIHSAFKL